MTNLSGNLSPQQKVSVACDGPQGVGMDILRNALDKAIPEGYKQTDIGVIPEDWETLTLDKFIVSTQLGGNYKNSESESNYPLIKMGNLNRGKIKLDKLEYVIGNVIPRDQLQYGDVLFNTRNTLELVGKVAIWRDELPEAYFNSNLMKFTFSDKFVSSNLYVNLAMNSDRFVTDLAGIATGTTSVAAIYTKDLLKLKLSLPPKKEQTAIANALSDMDALLSELENLIAKKQAIKTATMQQLLTGKTRLPQFAFYSDINSTEGDVEGQRNHSSATNVNVGACDDGYLASQESVGMNSRRKGTKPSELGEIPEDWEVVNLGEIISFKNGAAHEDCVDEYGNFVLVNSKFVSTEGRVRKGASECRQAASNNDLLMVMSDVPNGKAIAKCFLVDQDNLYTVNQRICILKPLDEMNPIFLLKVLSRNSYYLAFDDGAKQTNLRRQDVLSCPLVKPSKEEQTAIATILSDMDNEIQTLEQRLSKTRQIKQGMMQELLTGKTRLPFEKTNEQGVLS